MLLVMVRLMRTPLGLLAGGANAAAVKSSTPRRKDECIPFGTGICNARPNAPLDFEGSRSQDCASKGYGVWGWGVGFASGQVRA